MPDIGLLQGVPPRRSPASSNLPPPGRDRTRASRQDRTLPSADPRQDLLWLALALAHHHWHRRLAAVIRGRRTSRASPPSHATWSPRANGCFRAWVAICTRTSRHCSSGCWRSAYSLTGSIKWSFLIPSFLAAGGIDVPDLRPRPAAGEPRGGPGRGTGHGIDCCTLRSQCAARRSIRCCASSRRSRCMRCCATCCSVRRGAGTSSAESPRVSASSPRAWDSCRCCC